MMGFLRDCADAVEKAGMASNNNMHLFFGCRTHDERIYCNVINEWKGKNVLRLHLAL
jgi:sulfite reductase alpha subunit-like flavoprotein